MDESARRDELGGDMSVEREIPGTYGTATAGGRKGWVVPVLVALAVVSLAAAAVFGFLYLSSDVSSDDVGTALSEQSPQVKEVSEKVANLLLNYDSTNLEEVSAEMLSIATGNFREQYEEVLSSGAGLGTALEEASASSRGSILKGPDVYFQSGSEAIALMNVTQTAQSNSNPAGTTIDYVLKITLIDTQDGSWKADKVEVISTQQQTT
ncbi:MAG: hypothetical protein QOG04_762 [Actinomycetota bacterium]|nr:hypothetical protein [Actinomycetota bacterium]